MPKIIRYDDTVKKAFFNRLAKISPTPGITATPGSTSLPTNTPTASCKYIECGGNQVYADCGLISEPGYDYILDCNACECQKVPITPTPTATAAEPPTNTPAATPTPTPPPTYSVKSTPTPTPTPTSTPTCLSWCSFLGTYESSTSNFNSSEMPWWTGSGSSLALSACLAYREEVLGTETIEYGGVVYTKAAREPTASEDFIFAYRTRTLDPGSPTFGRKVVDGYRIHQDGFIKAAVVEADGVCTFEPCEVAPGGGSISVSPVVNNYRWATCCSS